MKAIAINGSPNKENGNTYLVAEPFLKGLKESGVTLEYFNSYDLDIKFCLGCNECLFRLGSKCVQNDDMDLVRNKIMEADIRILISPLYNFGLSAGLKNIIDRCLPFFSSFFQTVDDHTTHIPKSSLKTGKFVLISSCANWDKESFDPLVDHIEKIVLSANSEFVGYLLRPHAQAFRELPLNLKRDILEASEKAGRALVEQGRIPESLSQIISKELLSREDYVQMANDYFKRRKKEE